MREKEALPFPGRALALEVGMRWGQSVELGGKIIDCSRGGLRCNRNRARRFGPVLSAEQGAPDFLIHRGPLCHGLVEGVFSEGVEHHVGVGIDVRIAGIAGQ